MKKRIVSLALLIFMLLSTVVPSYAASPTTAEIVKKATEIIIASEGSYKSVNANDNGALSIGCIQWHATRALNLLKDIVNADKTNAYNILGQALYDEITTYTSWETRILTSDEASKISALIDTTAGRAEQDKLVADNVLSYITHGQNLGITNPAALVYFADVENQCGAGGAKRVATAASTLANGGEITLAILHQAALADSAAGKYSSRRNKVYNYAALLGWDDVISATPYEIWTVNANLNIRTGAGTSYPRISQYTANTTIIVYEQTYVGSAKWGRTSVGWISLEYCTFVRSVARSAGAFKLSFNAQGGELNTSAKIIIPIDYINSARPALSIAVYTPEYGSTTNTNAFGTEVVVSAAGYAQNDAAYGIGNSSIPTGGFVISAHGSDKFASISKNIAKGDYVVYNAYNKTIEVYSDYQSYIASNKLAICNAATGILPKITKKGYNFKGWFTGSGVHFDENTVVTIPYEFTLYAHWEPIKATVMFNAGQGQLSTPSATTKASGVNVYRNDNMLIVYDNNRGASTNTNKWGTEVAVNSAGIVTNIWPASGTGTGNHAIPQGGFVLSGHGTMDNWLQKNIKVGYSVKFDYSTYNVSVYSEDISLSQSITATYDQKLGNLPIPRRTGYVFEGWYTSAGTLVTSNTVSNFTESVVLDARWREKNSIIVGDVDGNGTVNAHDLVALQKEIKYGDSVEIFRLDINDDGKINVLDILALIKIIKNL
ncbi:MAG: InlB B-repeat-containing protein [Clostridia bacterium]|nr:InlB B-repeat-containing protein [Clostridia bacterium]